MNGIVCVDSHWGIGREGNQPIMIPDDLKRFKELTMGHPIIMGRVTAEALPGKKPLPGRRNLVLTTLGLDHPEGFEVYQDSYQIAWACKDPDAFVIGGEFTYREFFPYMTAIYVTRMIYDTKADRFFPNLDEDSNWIIKDISEPMIYDNPTAGPRQIPYEFITYRRVARGYRTV